MDILSRFCGVSMVQCVKLMLITFKFGVLLSDCFLYCQKCNLSVTFYQVWALRR